MAWQPIETAPDHRVHWPTTTRKQILVGFQGQFHFVMFIADAYGKDTYALGYAAPTHWHELPEPPS